MYLYTDVYGDGSCVVVKILDHTNILIFSVAMNLPLLLIPVAGVI